MNISLKPNAKKGKTNAPSRSLGYGLNPPPSKVFGGDDDDDDNDSEEEGYTIISKKNVDHHRQRVNQQIVKEQAALRQRAQAALQQRSSDNENTDIFDYDGAYDSFHPKSESKDCKAKETESKKSRYIGDLLQTAQKRKREREIIMERKIAKEQALEDQSAEYVGKEKFITKAYKRKLEEREQWQAEDDALQKKDEENDVTKKEGGLGMASFYGNLTKNVAMGGAGEENERKNSMDPDNEDDFMTAPAGGDGGFLAGFAKPSEPETASQDPSAVPTDGIEGTKKVGETSVVETSSLTSRERRNQKVAAARVRYLERKRLSEAPAKQ